MKTFTMALASAATMLAAPQARAACAFENETPIQVLAAGFEAWKAVTDAMAECGNVEAELDQEFRTKQPAAFAADPALYHVGGVSNGTITPLLAEGTIRPLDDLIAEHGQHLAPNQLIKIDGQTMAVAFMVNTQELTYRRDVLEELGIEPPTTWEEVLAAAEQLRGVEGIDYPLGGMTMAGWNLALEFINMHASTLEPLIGEDGTPNVANETGVEVLELMRELVQYYDPEYLVSDSTYVQQQMQQGAIAMANQWASRAGAMDDEVESSVVGLVETTAAPVASYGEAPSATLWWDGFVIAQNISDEEAEAAFRVAMEGMDREMVEANNDAAVWLIEGYEPGRLALGAVETATAVPPPPSYPTTAEMGLMHTALGNELSAFFTGDREAMATLEAVEESYNQAAQEAGLLQ